MTEQIASSLKYSKKNGYSGAPQIIGNQNDPTLVHTHRRKKTTNSEYGIKVWDGPTSNGLSSFDIPIAMWILSRRKKNQTTNHLTV